MAAVAMDITDQGTETLAAADFQALEERVLRAVELLKAEREAHAAATAKVEELQRHSAELERQLASRAEQSTRLEGEIGQLQQERDHVRGRVERLLKHLDEFTAWSPTAQPRAANAAPVRRRNLARDDERYQPRRHR